MRKSTVGQPRSGGRLHFRTAGTYLAAAPRARDVLIAALEAGRVPASPRLGFDTVAARWSARFEAMVAAGERHPRTHEAHRFHRCRACFASPVAAAGSSPTPVELLDACPSQGRILVEIALFSGLRISELLGLTWADIDFAASLATRASPLRSTSTSTYLMTPDTPARSGSRWQQVTSRHCSRPARLGRPY